MASISDKRIRLGIDTGFGHTKYAFFNDQHLSCRKFESVVAESADSLTDQSDGVFLFEGGHYYMAETALKQSNDRIKEMVTYEDLEKFSPLLIAEVLKREGLEPNEVDEIVCGLSPAHTQNASEFKKRISAFSVNGKEYAFNVKLIPQGVGAVYAIKHFSELNKLDEVNDYLVVDIGFNTIDVIFAYNKVIQKGKINKSNSFENKGALNIAKMMAKHISAELGKDIMLKEALQVVTNQKYILRGTPHDMSDKVAEFKTAYTKGIMDFLESKYGNEFDKMEKIYIVGGGGYFIDPKYAPHIQIFDKSEYFNAIGNLVIA